MSIDSQTIRPTSGTSPVGDLQRIQSVGDQNRRRRERHPLPQRPRLPEGSKKAPSPVYTPDGHVEIDVHGGRIDISV